MSKRKDGRPSLVPHHPYAALLDVARDIELSLVDTYYFAHLHDRVDRLSRHLSVLLAAYRLLVEKGTTLQDLDRLSDLANEEHIRVALSIATTED